MSAIHSATVDELAYLRADGRMARFALAFPASNVIWQGRINQVDFDLSYMSELTWDGATGSYANIVEGYTLWIGSSAGAYDLGKIRMRKAASSSKVFFDPVANIRFADNLYLTVVDDFEIKSKIMTRDSDGVVYANTDVAYVAQNKTTKPVLIMGGEVVLKLVGGTCQVIKYSADSWTPDGTIASTLWACATAFSVTNSTTNTATFVFHTTGTHLLSCQKTGSNGQVKKRYQKVVVWDDAHPPVFCRLETAPFEDYQEGGSECSVRAFDADAAFLKSGPKVILFDYKSYFDGDAISLGQCLGSENVALSGWVVGKTVRTDEATGDVLFTIRGNQSALKRAQGNAFQITRTIIDPVVWNEIENPTADLLYWHFINWQTTLADCVDCYPPGYDVIYPSYDGAKGNIFAQLVSIGEKIFAFPGFDKWGRLHFEVDGDVLSDSDKDAITEIMEVSLDDRATAAIDIIDSAPISAVYGTSLYAAEGLETRTLYSVSPGKVEGSEGDSVVIDDYASSQEDANSLAGRVYSARNNKENITVSLPQNNRLIGVFPRQVVSLTVYDTENPVDEYTGRMLIRSVRYSYDEASGAMSTDITGKFLQDEALSANGVIPVADGLGGIGGLDGFGDYELPVFLPDFNIPEILLPDLPDLPDFPGDEVSVVKTTLFGMTDLGELWYTRELDQFDQHYFLADPELSHSSLVRNFYISPDGHIYVVYGAEVWWATKDNLKFQPVFDTAWLQAQYPDVGDNDAGVAAVGVSPVDPNKLLLVLGNFQTQVGHFWSGDHTGVTQGGTIKVAPHSFYPRFQSDNGDITLGDGIWVCTFPGGSGATPIIVQMSLDGSAWIADASSFGSGIAYRQTRGNQGMIDFMYGPGNTALYKSIDNGISGTDTLENVSSSSMYNTVPVAVSPSGNKIMMVEQVATPKTIRYSSDIGVTFNDLTLPADFDPTALFNIDETNWIAAGREDLGGPDYAPLIYTSDDDGATWFPVYGNLPIVLPEIFKGFRKVIAL